MAQEEVRKGPWTQNEDTQLNFYVNLFGDRRWDFIAKVSGLKRTGKSCRLRWVNYLHPGLRRGKISPHEERLVVELHAKWGNRWSRIAQKLPGRTDNEIKNYWRTHMRKKAQELKQASPSSSSCFSFTSSSSSSINLKAVVDNDDRSFFKDGFAPSSLVSSNSYSSFDTVENNYYDTGGLEMLLPKKRDNEAENLENVISMDDIWKDIELFQSEELSKVMISPIWNHCSDSLWATEEEVKMKDMVFPPTTDTFWHVPF